MAAFIIFILLVLIQNKIVKDVEQKSVVVASVDVPQGLVLTEDNMQNYFKVETRDASTVPSVSFDSGYPLVGKVTSRKILAEEVVTDSCITEQDVYGDVEDPVELSIDVTKIGMGVGGTLRAGDLVDVKVIIDMSQEKQSEETETSDTENVADTSVPEMEVMEYAEGEGAETEPAQESNFQNITDTLPEETRENLEIWGVDASNYDYVEGVTGKYLCVTIARNVKITGVYTSSGVGTEAAESDGTSQVATVLNVVVPRSMQDSIYLALTEGTVYVSRVIDTSAFEVSKENETVEVAEEETEAAEETLQAEDVQ